MNFNSNYLPKSDVVFTVMFLNKELCEKTLNVILGETIELADVAVEYKNDLHKAALNSVYFDVRTMAKDGRIITLDLQRKYIKNRIRNRTIFYACREISTQIIEKSKYENLKSVIVTFLLTEATLKSTTDNSIIQLYNYKTGELYSDLLTIHEVNIKHITDKNSQDLQIIRDFFEVSNQTTYDKFVVKYSNTPFGSLLIENYTSAISNPSLLDTISKEEKFMKMLSEEERLEERQEGLKEGFKETARNMLKMNMDIVTISKATGLSEEEIKNLSSKQIITTR